MHLFPIPGWLKFFIPRPLDSFFFSMDFRQFLELILIVNFQKQSPRINRKIPVPESLL